MYLDTSIVKFANSYKSDDVTIQSVMTTKPTFNIATVNVTPILKPVDYTPQLSGRNKNVQSNVCLTVRYFNKGWIVFSSIKTGHR